MVRTPKSKKGSGSGRQKLNVKKTTAQKQAEVSGRLRRSIIEKNVRQENPRMTENQIGAEIRKKIAERKKPKPSTGSIFGRH